MLTATGTPPKPLGMAVAVGETQYIATSLDGVTWTSRASGFSGHLRGVAYSPTKRRAVAVGAAGGITTSPDGINWAGATSGASVEWGDVAWSEYLGKFVAVTSSGTGVGLSSDGLAWTNSTRTGSGITGFDRLVCNGPSLIARDAAGSIWWSADALAWTQVLTMGTSGWTGQSSRDLTVGPSGGLIVVGDTFYYDGSTGDTVFAGAVWHSPTGAAGTWSAPATTPARFAAVAYSPLHGRCIAASTTGDAYTSTGASGSAWTLAGSVGSNPTLLAWSGDLGKFIAWQGAAGSNYYRTSVDGATWTTSVSLSQTVTALM